MTSKLMELIDNNKENIEDGDYIKMCSILIKMNIKEMTKQYKIKYYKITYDNRYGTDENPNIIYQNIKIKTKIVIIENPSVLEYLEKLSSLNNDNDEFFLKFDKRDNNIIYLDIEENKFPSYHILYQESDEYLECGIKFNKILIINYMKYEDNI
jgi:hypothetical protein